MVFLRFFIQGWWKSALGLENALSHLEIYWKKSTHCVYIIPQADKWDQKIILVSKSCWIFNIFPRLQFIYQFMALIWLSFYCQNIQDLGSPEWYALSEVFDQFLSIMLIKNPTLSQGDSLYVLTGRSTHRYIIFLGLFISAQKEWSACSLYISAKLSK